ncbi:hypothetical protein GQ42DRAFT_52405 [Ramicandelaber brevisporus]|nr:hypothetical protein GQ42DRAFT_52405 [Ramicandelaber brevisporus]
MLSDLQYRICNSPYSQRRRYKRRQRIQWAANMLEKAQAVNHLTLTPHPARYISLTSYIPPATQLSIHILRYTALDTYLRSINALQPPSTSYTLRAFRFIYTPHIPFRLHTAALLLTPHTSSTLNSTQFADTPHTPTCTCTSTLIPTATATQCLPALSHGTSSHLSSRTRPRPLPRHRARARRPRTASAHGGERLLSS